MIIDKFEKKLNYKRILAVLECDLDNEQYMLLKDNIKKMENLFFNNINPICIYNINDNESSGYCGDIFVLYSIRGHIEKICDDFFKNGEYMNGLIINSIADDYLMNMLESISDEIENFCICSEIGIVEKGIPGENLPYNVQYDICKFLKSDKYGIIINNNFVLNPSKSLSFILKTKKGQNNTKLSHNCQNCEIKSCKWRKQAFISIIPIISPL